MEQVRQELLEVLVLKAVQDQIVQVVEAKVALEELVFLEALAAQVQKVVLVVQVFPLLI